MTQRVGLHAYVETDTKEMENSVKVCIAKTIRNNNAMTQRAALHAYVKTDTKVMANSVKVCMAKTINKMILE